MCANLHQFNHCNEWRIAICRVLIRVSAKWNSEQLNGISTKKHERNLVTSLSEKSLFQTKFTSSEPQQSR